MKTQTMKAHEHFGRYSGSIPNTGPILCVGCGATMEYTGSFKEKCARENKSDKAVAALRRVESSPAWKRSRAYVIIKKDDPETWGRLAVAYPADGMGSLRAFLWSPLHGEGLQYGHARGCGYNKLAAALDGMTFGGVAIKDDGAGWEAQLRAAGWLVIQAV